jgi:hypothetical protein
MLWQAREAYGRLGTSVLIFPKTAANAAVLKKLRSAFSRVKFANGEVLFKEGNEK